MRSSRAVFALTALMMASVLAVPAAASAGTYPTGQVVKGGVTVEPAYDLANGSMVFLSTPNGTQQGGQVHLTSKNNAPLYLPVYPAISAEVVDGASIDESTLNCQHLYWDNCPDHGPLIAAIAQSMGTTTPLFPGLPYTDAYASGVLGHDHLVGIASTGGDFNIVWVPTALFFTHQGLTDGAIRVHITTMTQVKTAIDSGDVYAIPLTAAAFKCASVAPAVYNHGTPVTPAGPFPPAPTS